MATNVKGELVGPGRRDDRRCSSFERTCFGDHVTKRNDDVQGGPGPARPQDIGTDDHGDRLPVAGDGHLLTLGDAFEDAG